MMGSLIRGLGIFGVLIGFSLQAETVVLDGKFTLSDKSLEKLADSVCPQPDGGSGQKGGCCPKEVNRNVTPSARGCPGNCGLYLTAEFLYWQGTETDLWIAFQDTLFTSTANRAGRYQRFGFDWEPGFRVGLGWNVPYDGWDLCAKYTWYLNNSSSTFTSPISLPVGINTVFGFTNSVITGTGPVLYSRVKGNWRMNYDIFDLELGRAFFVSRGLSLRPYAGARGGWINRQTDVNYSDGLVVLSGGGFTPNTPAIGTTYSGKVNFWGIGPRIGFEGDWGFFSHFFLFNDISASILYARSHSSMTASESSNPQQTLQVFFHAIDKGWRAVSNL